MLLTPSHFFSSFSLQNYISVLDIVMGIKAMYNLKSTSASFLDFFFLSSFRNLFCKSCIKIPLFFLRRMGASEDIKHIQF